MTAAAERRPGPALIGLVGPARAGKDSIAARLRTRLRDRHLIYYSIALADRLWEAVRAIHPGRTWTDAAKGDPILDVPRGAGPRDPRIPRGWAIVIGEAARTAYGPTIWAELALDSARRADAQVVIVTDIRRISEVEVFRGAGAALYEITRPARPVDDEVFEPAVRELVDLVVDVPEGGRYPGPVLERAADRVWWDAVARLGLDAIRPPPRSCNRHEDCNAADDRARAAGLCRDEACEDCHGA